MPDEGLQEIQLRGKQLVFLAMSATVVAVVIFLCGVMVGRGVPSARQAVVEPIEADADVLTTTETGTLSAAASGEFADAAPGAAGAAPAPLQYPEIVSEQPPADQPLKPSPPARPFAAETAVARAGTPRRATNASAAPAAKAVKADTAATAANVDTSTPAPKAKASPAVTGSGGFQVQVAAYQREGDASTVRDRLTRKGYPAFVTTATTSAGTWFRVRVGGYETRDEAQAIATRLKREEQLEPWVTR